MSAKSQLPYPCLISIQFLAYSSQLQGIGVRWCLQQTLSYLDRGFEKRKWRSEVSCACEMLVGRRRSIPRFRDVTTEAHVHGSVEAEEIRQRKRKECRRTRRAILLLPVSIFCCKRWCAWFYFVVYNSWLEHAGNAAPIKQIIVTLFWREVIR